MKRRINNESEIKLLSTSFVCFLKHQIIWKRTKKKKKSKHSKWKAIQDWNVYQCSNHFSLDLLLSEHLEKSLKTEIHGALLKVNNTMRERWAIAIKKLFLRIRNKNKFDISLYASQNSLNRQIGNWSKNKMVKTTLKI